MKFVLNTEEFIHSPEAYAMGSLRDIESFANFLWRSAVTISKGGRPSANIAGGLLADGINLAVTALLTRGAGVFGRAASEGVETNEAVNHISGLRLKRSLNVERASSAFTETGALRPGIINNSDLIIRGDQLGNQELIDALMQKGGNMTDWAKYSTESIPSPAGDFKVHFYRNIVTGDVYYGMDYKTVFNHHGSWKFKPRPSFEYEPSQHQLGY